MFQALVQGQPALHGAYSTCFASFENIITCIGDHRTGVQMCSHYLDTYVSVHTEYISCSASSRDIYHRRGVVRIIPRGLRLSERALMQPDRYMKISKFPCFLFPDLERPPSMS